MKKLAWHIVWPEEPKRKRNFLIRFEIHQKQTHFFCLSQSRPFDLWFSMLMLQPCTQVWEKNEECLNVFWMFWNWLIEGKPLTACLARCKGSYNINILQATNCDLKEASRKERHLIKYLSLVLKSILVNQDLPVIIFFFFLCTSFQSNIFCHVKELLDWEPGMLR